MLESNHSSRESLASRRCYDCFRPQADCFCAAIPRIENQTEVLILQHRRERFHPFNTARIVRQALTNSQFLVDHTVRLAERLTERPSGQPTDGAILKLRAGLLYPGPDAALLSDLPADRRPEQLVILDGTWHHAKTMLRDIPALGDLPRYRLAPAAPSRYGFRREPDDLSISTVEAVIGALEILEPETRGLDQLMAAFLTMVERQLAHPKSADGCRTRRRPKRTFQNIPVTLVGDLYHVVAAYGESTSQTQTTGNGRAGKWPISWVAERLGTGERFYCLIRPPAPLPESLLGHLELTRDDFTRALSLEEARTAWQAFLRPGDTPAVYNQGTARLLAQLSPKPVSCLVLKSVDLYSPRYETLDELLASEGILTEPTQHPGRAGRAGKRLANLTAFVRHLNGLANARLNLSRTMPT